MAIHDGHRERMRKQLKLSLIHIYAGAVPAHVLV